MKGQRNLHVLIKRTNGFTRVPVCGREDLRLLRERTDTTFLLGRIYMIQETK